MPTQDERLVSLEARVDAMSDLRRLIAELGADMDSRFAELRADMNAPFSDVNSRLTEVNARFDHVDHLLTALDQKIDRHFIWLVGTQVAVLLSVVGALVGVAYR